MDMSGIIKEIKRGIFKDNAIFSLTLGLCPAFAVTTSITNGIGMGLATMAVLIVSNIIISLIKDIVPDKVRIPGYIIVIASIVTIVDMLMHAYFYEMYKSLGIFIPLIVVNCIILGRAEAFASKNNPFISAVDGLGVGIGFTLALALIGGVREILGNGSIFGFNIMGEWFQPALIFLLPPGAFIAIGFLVFFINLYKMKKDTK